MPPPQTNCAGHPDSHQMLFISSNFWLGLGLIFSSLWLFSHTCRKLWSLLVCPPSFCQITFSGRYSLAAVAAFWNRSDPATDSSKMGFLIPCPLYQISARIFLPRTPPGWLYWKDPFPEDITIFAGLECFARFCWRRICLNGIFLKRNLVRCGTAFDCPCWSSYSCFQRFFWSIIFGPVCFFYWGWFGWHWK